MAAKKEIVEEVVKDTVTVMLPRPAKNEAPDVFVAVNGKTFLIKKGVPVEVPRAVAEVLRHSDDAKNEADSFIDAIS